MKTTNIFASIPEKLSHEVVDILIHQDDVKIERIVSKGHRSPKSGWYDQHQNEWVIVLKGSAIITFEAGEDTSLQAGDHINIPAHTKHKVSWTDPDIETIWLAIYYGKVAL